VAVALIGDPDLVFLDEPTTGFDPTARREAWNMIEGLKSLGKTVFLTTHYMDEAQHLADRVVIIARGRIVAEGKPDELGAAGKAGATVVRFRLPQGYKPEQVSAEVDAKVEVAGGVASFEADRPQRALYRLTGWAEREGIELVDIEVRRPSLEDVFLQLTGSEAQR